MKTKIANWFIYACCLFIGFACNGKTQQQDTKTEKTTETVFSEFIQKQYPNAQIMTIEKEVNGTEANIKDNGIEKEVYFDNNKQWVSTSWEIKADQIPVAIMDGLLSSAYAEYDLKDITLIERPDGIFYVFDLSDNDNNVQVVYNSDAQVVTNIEVEK